MLTVSSLIVVESAFAQSVPKPSVPELNVTFVNHSYDVPSTTITTINPYTGDKIANTKDGYHIQNDSFVLSIRSQPLTTDDEVNGHSIRLFFIVQSKGHYSDQWRNLTYVGTSLGLMSTNDGYAQKTMELSGNNGTTYSEEGGYNSYGYDGFVSGQYGGQVDFRAMAVVGYVVVVEDALNFFNARHPYHDELFALQSSGWSSTQTITIPTSEPTKGTWETWQSGLIIGISVVFVLAVSISLVYSKKRKRTFDRQTNID